MDRQQAARKLGVDPAGLDPAPVHPRRADIVARVLLDPPMPCSACGAPSRTSGVVQDPQHGPRWLDRCRDCFLATPPRLRVPLDQALTDLREIAADVGVRLTIIADGDVRQ